MHTYIKQNGGYVTGFEYDRPADTNFREIKSFAEEWLAAAFAAYLNGGTIGGEYDVFFPDRVGNEPQQTPREDVAAQPEPEAEPELSHRGRRR